MLVVEARTITFLRKVFSVVWNSCFMGIKGFIRVIFLHFWSRDTHSCWLSCDGMQI